MKNDVGPTPDMTKQESAYAKQLRLTNRLTQGAVRQAIRSLALPSPSAGLDAASGIGSHAFWLADILGPKVHITGVDWEAEFLNMARHRAEELHLEDRVRFVEGDLYELPFDDDSFDWVWCSNALWPTPATDESGLESALRRLGELTRVVKPGGTIAIVYWTAQKLLSGYPVLEDTLELGCAKTYPYLAGAQGERHYLRTLGWLQQVGLRNCQGHSFVADVCAPLDDAAREALVVCFDMLWGDLESYLDPENWALFRRATEPGSPECLLDRPDYYGFVIYTLFHGQVPEK